MYVHKHSVIFKPGICDTPGLDNSVTTMLELQLTNDHLVSSVNTHLPGDHRAGGSSCGASLAYVLATVIRC